MAEWISPSRQNRYTVDVSKGWDMTFKRWVHTFEEGLRHPTDNRITIPRVALVEWFGEEAVARLERKEGSHERGAQDQVRRRG
jgi:hypothetical protein